MEGRREARERALGLLYESTAKSTAVDQIVDALPVPPDPYAIRLALGVQEDQDQIDEVLTRHVRGWTLARMPQIDLALLRMATFELAQEIEVPVPVVISEAVALAKTFSTDDSGKFVNGVLREVALELRGERA